MHITETTESARRPPTRSKARREMSTEELKRRFLEAYERYGTVTSACRIVELSRDSPYRWRQQDPEFNEAFENSRNVVADDLEQEALRRAHDGSDLLLIFMLKALRPDKYRERFQADLNVDSAAIRSFFDRAASQPLGPPAITGDIDASALEAD